MADSSFPITRARERLGFTPSTSVRGGQIDTSTGGVELGKAMSRLGQTVTGIHKHRQQMQDANSSAQADRLRALADEEFLQFKATNPQEEWEEFRRGQTERVTQEVSALPFSRNALAKEQIRSKTYSEVSTAKALTAATLQLRTDTIDSLTEAMTDAFRSGDPEKILKAVTAFKNNGKNMGKDTAEVLSDVKAATAAGEKLRSQDAVAFKRNQASLSPASVVAEMEAEKELRREGKGVVPEQVLSNEDLEDIIDFANSVADKNKTDSVAAANIAVENNYAKIIGGDTDINSMIVEIQANPTISEEDSIKATDKVVTFFSKWNDTKTATESNSDAYELLTQASESVERGAMSPSAFEELYVDNKAKLTEADRRDVRSKDVVATRTMQNRAFSDAIIFARPTLIELTESELGALKLARQNAEIIKDLPSINFFNIAIKKNQAEQWNLGRFRRGLRSQIAQNPEWSQKQIFVAEEILTDQLDLPVGELLKAFDASNPNSAIMSEPPDVSFEDIWPDMDVDDRAKIWELKMRGASTAAILGEIKK